MKRCCTVIALCALVAGCDKAAPPFAPDPGSPSPTDTPTTFYTLSGRTQDDLGAAVPGVLVQLAESQKPIRTTMSDELGQYRFENVRGSVAIYAIKTGYGLGIASALLESDQTLTVTLTPERKLLLTVGTTLHGAVQDPPCDPQGWDAQAPCQRVFFTPPATGVYELVLTWNGPNELDLLIDGSLYFDRPTAPGQIRARVTLQEGAQHEIRIHSYYGVQAFELTALKSTP